MKHLMIVGVLSAVMAGDALAQGSEIYTRWGPSGSHVQLAEGAQIFHYDATISSTCAHYTIKLEVYHNSVQKFTSASPGGVPGVPLVYGCPVDMTTWGLVAGDLVTFVLKVIDTASGATLATHVLYGDVLGT